MSIENKKPSLYEWPIANNFYATFGVIALIVFAGLFMIPTTPYTSGSNSTTVQETIASAPLASETEITITQEAMTSKSDIEQVGIWLSAMSENPNNEQNRLFLGQLGMAMSDGVLNEKEYAALENNYNQLK